ncbi:minor capsid protein [Arthrobacter sp. zg-Y859]|uniref:Minor capsid protein n=1 Tax=Arthrobacter jinronghuae TaxID=2964609 RepID=A0ABT1NV61_9MICC|nr:minor capsid protein [Arthrobacter jinronghuae]MCQ1951619.1 minor capsid protein [Arthrobacter jinronghuae]UWX79667.1 minor capsid protein [Arthrobacter jinronghuae]
MSFEIDLLTAVGEYLGAKGAGRWLATGTYKATDVAITIDELPATPDRGIAMSLYDVEDTPGTDSVVGLQLWIRGAKNKTSAKETKDAVFDALHNLQAVTWAGIPIVRIWRQSGANLGTDGNGRQEISQNYYIQLTRTGPNRAD